MLAGFCEWYRKTIFWLEMGGKVKMNQARRKGWFRLKDDDLVEIYFNFASLSNQQI